MQKMCKYLKRISSLINVYSLLKNFNNATLMLNDNKRKLVVSKGFIFNYFYCFIWVFLFFAMLLLQSLSLIIFFSTIRTGRGRRGENFMWVRSAAKSSREFIVRQIVPEKWHLILVRSRLQLEFKLGCRGDDPSCMRARARTVRRSRSLRNFVTTEVFSTPKIPFAPGRIH